MKDGKERAPDAVDPSLLAQQIARDALRQIGPAGVAVLLVMPDGTVTPTGDLSRAAIEGGTGLVYSESHPHLLLGLVHTAAHLQKMLAEHAANYGLKLHRADVLAEERHVGRSRSDEPSS